MDVPQDNGSDGTMQSEREILPLDQVKPDPEQPRKGITNESVKDLRQSIEQEKERGGVLNPIWVRPHPDGEGYMIIAGHRRYHAARLAGLTDIPVIIFHVDEQTARRMQLIENLQRQDLDPFEEAEGYERLLSETGMFQKDAAKALGKDDGYISAIRTLRTLDPRIQREYRRGKKLVSKWLLIEIAKEKDQKAQLDLWNRIQSGDLRTVKAAQEARRGGGSTTGEGKSAEDIRRELSRVISAAKPLISVSMNYFPEHPNEWRRLVGFADTLAHKIAELRREFGDPPPEPEPESAVKGKQKGKRGRKPSAKAAPAADEAQSSEEVPDATGAVAEATDAVREETLTPSAPETPA